MVTVLCMLATLLIPGFAQAQTAPQGITLEGTIFSAAGLPEEAANVGFTIQIKSPGSESCVLYQETQTLNMSNSGGTFAFTIGQGIRPSSGFEATSSLRTTFNNNPATLSELNCHTGSSYTPSTGDTRSLVLTFNDGTGSQTVTQALDTESVPYALFADSLQGKLPGDFINVNSATAALTQTNLEGVFNNSSSVTALEALIAGSSSLYAKSSATGGVSIPTYASAPSTPTKGSVWFNTGSNTLNFFDGTSTQSVGTSGGSVSSITAGTGLSGGTITTSGTISMPSVGTASTYTKVTTDAQGRVTSGGSLVATDIPNLDAAKITTGTFASSLIPSGTDTTKLPLAGGTMTGAIVMGNNNITNTGFITQHAQTYLGLGAYTDSAEATLISTLTPAASYAGVTWYNSTTNQIKYWNGTTTSVLATGSTAIASLNGLTTATQTFANGTAGTAPAFLSSGSTHTLNIPFASTAGTTAGLIANTDYTNWNKSILKDGTVAFTADQPMGSHKLTGLTDPASAQDAATKNYADSKVAGKSLISTFATDVSGTSGNGFVMTWDQAGNQWKATAPAASGTVTSVGLSLPSIFTVTASPVTSSGTLTGALANEAQNSIFAGPATGGAGVPSFRSLASSDLPTVLVAQGGTGSTSLTPNGILMANGTGSSVSSSFCATGQALVATSGSTWGCQSVTAASTGFVNGGNSFGSNALLGTNDNYGLGFETNGVVSMTLTNSGAVGIGTTAPSATLDVVGSGNFSNVLGIPGGVGANPGFHFNSVGTANSYGNNIGFGLDTSYNIVASIAGESFRIVNSAGNTPWQTSNIGNTSQLGTLTVAGAGSSSFVGNLGIGTTTPGAPLDVKGAIRMSGATSGYTGFQPAAVAGSTVWTLPAADGSSGQFLSTNGAGILSWSSASAGGITALTGDVTASGTGSVAATVASVGGSTAANLHTAEVAANAATNLNAASTIVRRDPSGNFSAGAVSPSSVIYRDGASNTVTVQAPTSVATSYVLKLPTATGAANQTMITDGAGNLSWASVVSQALSPGNIYVGNASSVATSVALSGDATLSNAGAITLNTVSVAKGGTGSNTQAPNGIIMANGTGSALTSNFCATGQALVAGSSSTWGCQSVTSAATGFINGGNTFGAPAILGTNDSNYLNFVTAGTTRMTFDATGFVGIGTAAPDASLSVNAPDADVVTQAALDVNRNVNAAVDDNNGSFGIVSNFFLSGTKNYSNGYFNGYSAIVAQAQSNTSGSVNAINGVVSAVYNNSATSTAAGYYAYIEGDGGTINNAYGLEVDTSGTYGGSIVNNFGIYVADQTAGSNSNYAIFTAGSAPSSFGGSVAVNGAITSTAVPNSSTAIDFSTGNLQYTSASCGALTLTNMVSGGSYQLAVQGTAGGTCSFTIYSDAGSTALTVKAGPVNMTQSANTHMLFSFSVMGGYVYVASANGY